MHKHHTAHRFVNIIGQPPFRGSCSNTLFRDCTSVNFMMDPANFYIDASHPVNPEMKRDYSGRARFRTRTLGPPKYFWIDFGLSRRYDPFMVEPKEVPIWGADKEVPEFQNSNKPRNPFPTDVFYAGNMIKNDFIDVSDLHIERPGELALRVCSSLSVALSSCSL